MRTSALAAGGVLLTSVFVGITAVLARDLGWSGALLLMAAAAGLAAAVMGAVLLIAWGLGE